MNPLQRIHSYLLCLVPLFSTPVCADDLATSVYLQTHSDNSETVATSFVVLAHLALSPEFLLQAEQDYGQERGAAKKFYYEYLLAMRTQQENNIQRYSQHACAHREDLLDNRTGWISVSSPFYQALSYYALTESAALECLLKLVDQADGATAEELSSDLKRILKLSPGYFRQAATKAGFSEQDIRQLSNEAE